MLLLYQGSPWPAVPPEFRYLIQFVSGHAMTPDQKIMKISQDWPRINEALAGQQSDQEGFIIIGSLITACIRSLTTTQAKIEALHLMLDTAQCVPPLVFFSPPPPPKHTHTHNTTQT